MLNELVCKICGGRANTSGSLKTENSQNAFDFARCAECGFGWVLNPRTDFENIYNHNYYIGEGVDPVVKFCPLIQFARAGKCHDPPRCRWNSETADKNSHDC